jgi:putative addiction module component (TIGR02574 family)
MSKAEILEELPKLTPGERREIAAKLHELDGGELTDEEKALLDRELADYAADPKAGSAWDEVEARIRRGGRA